MIGNIDGDQPKPKSTSFRSKLSFELSDPGNGLPQRAIARCSEKMKMRMSGLPRVARTGTDDLHENGCVIFPVLLLLAGPASARMSRMQAVETCVAQAHHAMGVNNNPFDTSANSRAGVGIYSGCMRNIATRFDKLAENYLAALKLVAVRIWLRRNESTS